MQKKQAQWEKKQESGRSLQTGNNIKKTSSAKEKTQKSGLDQEVKAKRILKPNDYIVFVKSKMLELSDVPPKDRMKVIAAEWKQKSQVIEAANDCII